METVAERVVAGLLAAKVTTVYGLPGGENVELVDAFRRAGIAFVLAHHEAAAVFMADAAARLTGIPGVCMTTLGPGATNAVVGVAHAYLDRAPVLFITAQVHDQLRPQHTHQFIDLPALLAPITKASIQITPANAAMVIASAMRLATAGRPGPIHLQLSNDDAAKPAEPAQATQAQREPVRGTWPDLAAARALLAQAKRPVIVAGLGLEPERPYDALCTLAEAASAPVITTPKAKGALPDSHPLAAGTIGLTRSDPAYAILDEADCILAIGFDVVELVKPWHQPVPTIWLAAWENSDPTIPAQATYVGPLRLALQQLATTTFAPAAEWGDARVAQLRATVSRSPMPVPAHGRMLPQAVLTALHRAAPRDVIITTDVGSHKILASLTWPTYTPNSFLLSNGLSAMGFGLPAAIAASMARRGRSVVCLTGDAGLAMAMGELGVLARYGLPVTVIVFHDGALDLIRSQQRRAGRAVYATEFSNPDFMKIAAAYAIAGYRVRSEAQCVDAITAAIVSAQPALIEALIDPSSYPTTPQRTT